MASRFWVGGTGTWDASSTTHWSASSGGASGASVPGSSDTVTFDGSSGGGTVTVNTTVNVTSITMGAFTGTLDFSANNNDVTLQSFNGSGSGVRTLNMGNGTWTLTGTTTLWNFGVITNLTFNANSSSLTFTATTGITRSMTGNLTYNVVNVSANSLGGSFNFSGGMTLGTLTITGQNCITFQSGITYSMTALNIIGSSGAEVSVRGSTDSSSPTISIASGTPTISWTGLRDLNFTGGATFAASNSFDFGHTSGITITAPSGAGGGLLVNPGMSGGMVA